MVPVSRAIRHGITTPEAVTLSEVERVSTSEDTCPQNGCIPLGGGADLASSTGNLCTTGFTFVRSGARTTSTAGHCAGSPWDHGGTAIGGTVWTQDAASVDGKLIRIDDNDLWKATNLVYRPAKLRITLKISNPDNSLQGITVCQAGQGKTLNGRARESCGAVTSIDGETKDWDNMGVARVVGCSGDSGGPVYNAATGRAYGLYRGRKNPTGNCGGDEYMFTWTSRVEAASGASVLLAQ